MRCNSYTINKIIWLSVRLSVTECQQKQFDLKTQDGTVSPAIERYRLELGDFCVCQSVH